MNVEDVMNVIARGIEEGIRAEVESRQRGDDGKIHVTMVVQCLRKSYFELSEGAEGTMNYAVLVGLISHELLERFIAEALGAYGNVETEVEVEYEDLVGHADLVFETEGKKYVIELKTTQYRIFEPFDKHRRQVCIYATMLNAEAGIIVYVNRRDGSIRMFNVSPDRRTLEVALNRARILRRTIETGVPPEPEYTPECHTCPFRERCALKHAWW